MVLNLGVTLPDTPLARHGYHWLYIPDSTIGFHRIGYYSNVDPMFLPEDRRDKSHASLYIETAFRERPAQGILDATVISVMSELQQCGLIERVEISDPTFVDVAYTWRNPNSTWVERSIAACRANNIEPVGRYGRWCFQGIAASIREGLMVGSMLKGG